jgi:hypothetical protein
MSLDNGSRSGGAKKGADLQFFDDQSRLDGVLDEGEVAAGDPDPEPLGTFSRVRAVLSDGVLE